jgi:cation diffusion facilitator family transporter
MAGHGDGKKAIVAALLANLGIAAAKFIGFFITGASSMLAEAFHSVADSGNQCLLFLARKKGSQPPTEKHPFGYGMERYFWAFVVALVLFTLGAAFAMYEGISKLRHPHEIEKPGVAITILGIACVIEFLSIRVAVREARKSKGGRDWAAFIRDAKDPEIPVVLLEDAGAMAGLLIALVGISAATAFDEPRIDGVTTCVIGALLACVAIVLAMKTKSLLLGESASREHEAAIRKALEGDGIESVIHLRTMHLGPETLLIAAKIAVVGNTSSGALADTIDRAEARVRKVVPITCNIYLEPDLRESV